MKRPIKLLGCLCLLAPLLGVAGWISGLSPERKNDMPAVEKMRTARVHPTDSVDLQLPFAVDSLCVISDPAHTLDVFLGELERLLAGEDTVVPIVHLGDSHVQAGFYSGQIMRMLHDAFGNAGRGWIAPLKLARVNEPKDYRITSSGVKEWAIGRCVQKDPGCPWGLGGVGIRPRSKKVDLSVGITPTGGAGYGFREVCFYRDVRTPRLLPDTTGLRWTEAVCGSDPRAPDVLIDTFRLTNTVDSLHLYGVEEDSLGSTAGSYYGFSLTNGCPGILYHAIGQNGAMFANYATGDYVRQLSLLNPSLLIVTLGTNEAYGIRSFREEAFVARMNEFVDLVRTHLPSTAILLTTPAESFRRTRNGFVRNENIARAARAITEYAESGGLACFDLYQATGGANSCREWQNGKLLGRDRIHFTVDGYCEQGKLLYRAIIRLKIERQNHTAS